MYTVFSEEKSIKKCSACCCNHFEQRNNLDSAKSPCYSKRTEAKFTSRQLHFDWLSLAVQCQLDDVCVCVHVSISSVWELYVCISTYAAATRILHSKFSLAHRENIPSVFCFHCQKIPFGQPIKLWISGVQCIALADSKVLTYLWLWIISTLIHRNRHRWKKQPIRIGSIFTLGRLCIFMTEQNAVLMWF